MNPEYLTKQGIRENIDLRNLNFRQLEKEAQKADENGQILNSLIAGPVSAAERNRMMEERLHWVKRRLAIYHLSDIEGRKECARSDKRVEEIEKMSPQLELEAAKAYEHAKLVLNEMEIELEQLTKEDEAEKKRKDKEFKEWAAEFESKRRLQDEQQEKNRLKNIELLGNLNREVSRDAQRLSENLRRLERKTTFQNDLEETQCGARKAHHEGTGLGCSGKEAEISDRPQESEDGAEENGSDRLKLDLSQSSKLDIQTLGNQDDVISCHNIQQEDQSSPKDEFQEDRGVSVEDGNGVNQQTMISDDIDYGVSEPLINPSKAAEKPTRAIDPVWEYNSGPRERSNVGYIDPATQTSTEHCISVNQDERKYMEFIRPYRRPQRTPSCPENKLSSTIPNASEHTTEQFDYEKLYGIAENLMPENCVMLKHRDLPDEKVFPLFLAPIFN
jgi:hypothetical protein